MIYSDRENFRKGSLLRRVLRAVDSSGLPRSPRWELLLHGRAGEGGIGISGDASDARVRVRLWLASRPVVFLDGIAPVGPFCVFGRLFVAWWPGGALALGGCACFIVYHAFFLRRLICNEEFRACSVRGCDDWLRPKGASQLLRLYVKNRSRGRLERGGDHDSV